MRTQLAALAATAAVAVAVLPAQAAPYAGSFGYLSTGTVAVRGADGARWLLSLTATADEGTSNRTERNLYLDLSRCVGSECVAKGHWVRALTPAEVSVDASRTTVRVFGFPEDGSAALRTVLGDRDLSVDLTAYGGGGTAFPGVGTTTDPVGVQPQVYDYFRAVGTVRIGGLVCRLDKQDRSTIGRVVVVDTLGPDARDPRTPPPARLPKGFLSGGSRAVSC